MVNLKQLFEEAQELTDSNNKAAIETYEEIIFKGLESYYNHILIVVTLDNSKAEADIKIKENSILALARIYSSIE